MTLVPGLLGVVALSAAAVAATAGFVLFRRVRGAVFDAEGVPIHYTDEGSGVPVLLVHGFAVHADLNWRRPGCVRALRCRGYRVVMLDVRGHGLSGKPHDPAAYGIHLCDDIVRLMDHLGIEKAFIAGYSMGGFIVLKTVERHPSRLLGAVIGAAGWDELDDDKRALFREIVAAIEERGVFDPITHWLDPGKKAGRIQCALANFFMGVINDKAAIVNVFRTFEALVVSGEALRNNTVPALTLVGARDGIREASDKLPGVMARHELVHLPGTDHVTTMLHPQFMRRMIAFFEANAPG